MSNEAAYSYQENYQKYELINGQVYMMSRPKANHARVSKNISNIFANYLKGKTCESFTEFELYLSEEDHFIPDEMIVCDPDIVKEDAVYGVPDLVVEILSRSTARKDRAEKFFKYEKYGVKEYWIISPQDKFVEVYIRKDEKLVLDYIYGSIYKGELEQLTEKEKEEIRYDIKVSLYDDFLVNVEEIFDRVK